MMPIALEFFLFIYDTNTSPVTNTIFLGIELDSLNQCAKWPLNKLDSYYVDIKGTDHVGLSVLLWV